MGKPLGRALASKKPTLPITCTVFTMLLSHCVTSSGGVLPCDAAAGAVMRGRRLAAAGLVSAGAPLQLGTRVDRLRACRIAHSWLIANSWQTVRM